MSLKRLRAHCREMAQAEHKPDCLSLTAKEPWWDPWMVTDTDANGVPTEFSIRGPKPKWEPPKCDGCNPAEDRALFAQIADEIDAHLGDQLALFAPSP